MLCITVCVWLQRQQGNDKYFDIFYPNRKMSAATSSDLYYFSCVAAVLQIGLNTCSWFCFGFHPKQIKHLSLSWRSLMAESMNSWRWVSTELRKSLLSVHISSWRFSWILMDFKKKLSGCLHDTIFCYAKNFVMRLLHVLVYLAGTDITVLEAAKI